MLLGSVPAGNYIQFPRTTTQSLGLTGRYLYILFKVSSFESFQLPLFINFTIILSHFCTQDMYSMPLFYRIFELKIYICMYFRFYLNLLARVLNSRR